MRAKHVFQRATSKVDAPVEGGGDAMALRVYCLCTLSRPMWHHSLRSIGIHEVMKKGDAMPLALCAKRIACLEGCLETMP